MRICNQRRQAVRKAWQHTLFGDGAAARVTPGAELVFEFSAQAHAPSRGSAHPRILASLGAVLVVAVGFAALSGQAREEAKARKSAEALSFELAPEEWLAQQHSASNFRQALDAGTVVAVGLATAQPGLVLYTLKDGSKASTTISNCTVLGCAGTALDPIDDKSAAAGFALVRVDVDPRTVSRRMWDAMHAVLTPLLVLGSVSSGASDDLKRASELAIRMVGSLGFSQAFGLLSVAGVPKGLLGPDTQAAVLKEARALLEQAQAQAQALLAANRVRLDALAQGLLEHEVLSGPELAALLGERQWPMPLAA